jgi:hypothetical protein
MISGSVILWQSPGLIPWLIRLFSRYSHASLVVRMNDEELRERVWLVEAMEQGLVLRILSYRLRGYKGRCFVLIPEISLGQESVVKAFAMGECGSGKGYDFLGLFGNVFGRVSANARRYFCSEFVYAALVEAGVCPPLDHAPRPGDLPEWIGGQLYEIQLPLNASSVEASA